MLSTDSGPAIVGWSVLSPLGVGRAEFVEAMRSGRTGCLAGPGREPHLSTPGYVIDDFDAARLIGSKGTRTLDRMTSMVIATSGMVLSDHWDTFGDSRESIGLVLGTSTGSIASITDFTRDTFVQDRPYLVNPAAFPNTVMNGAAGRTAIWHQLRGPNSTISAGHLTGLVALRYATRMIRRGYVDTLLVGGVEELSTSVGHAASILRGPGSSAAGSAAGSPAPLGEGCVFFLVDGAATAARAGRAPLAEIVGFQFGVVPLVESQPRELVRSARSAGLAAAITALLRRHELVPSDLWLVSLAQSGDTELDAAESDAVETALGGSTARQVVAARQTGDCFSALGAFQLAAVLTAADGDHQRPAGARPCLVTSIGADGAVGCALLSV